MKTFQFRLDQALRWRSTQADLAKARMAAAMTRISTLQTELDLRRKQLNDATSEVHSGGPGFIMGTWNVWSRRLRREIGQIQKFLETAERLLGEEMRILVEANRKVRLLENLKNSGQKRWSAELDREAEAFASEAFLVGYNRESKRARSSGG